MVDQVTAVLTAGVHHCRCDGVVQREGHVLGADPGPERVRPQPA